MNIYEKTVDTQLQAYNSHDINNFLDCFDDNIECFDAQSGNLLFSGKNEMRKLYEKLFGNKTLTCSIQNRITINNAVIDLEIITSKTDKKELSFKSVVIYEINSNNKISRFYTIKLNSQEG